MKPALILLLFLTGLSTCFGQAPLQITPTRLTFRAAAEGETPPPQTILLYTNLATNVEFAVAVDSGSPGSTPPAWISVNTLRASSPVRLVVSANQAGLGPGEAPAARILISAPAGPLIREPIPVTLTVDPPAAPRLSLTPDSLQFSVQSQRGDPVDLAILVRNAGSGPLPAVTATVTTPTPWLRVALDPCTRECIVRVSALVINVPIGAYRGVVRIAAGTLGVVDVPVSLLIADRGPMLELSHSAVRLEARQGHGQSETTPLQIRNVGDTGVINWTAEVFRGARWLRLSASSGIARIGEPGSVDIIADPSGLAPGVYSSLVRVGWNEQSAPLYVPVSLAVSESTAPAVASFSQAGLFFRAQLGGASTTEQSVRMWSSSAEAISYQAATRVDRATSTAWLTVSPARDTISTASPRPLFFQATPGNLSTGIYTGEAVFWQGGSELRAVNAMFVITPPGMETCTPLRLGALHTTLVNNFSLRAALPAMLSVRVVDDCGSTITNAQVLATFSTDEQAVPLTHSGGGVYSGVWVPLRNSANLPGGMMTVFARAWRTGLEPAVAPLTGRVTDNRAPVLARNGVLNSFNRQLGAAVAPGTVVEVYGLDIASVDADAVVVNRRLPTTLGGSTLLIGNAEMPLYNVRQNPSQINAQIPVELANNRQYQVVVARDNAFSQPEMVHLTPLSPGLAAFADGRVIAQDVGFQLIDSSNPARRNNFFTIYVVGLGFTNPPVPTGMLPPDSPPTRN